MPFNPGLLWRYLCVRIVAVLGEYPLLLQREEAGTLEDEHGDVVVCQQPVVRQVARPLVLMPPMRVRFLPVIPLTSLELLGVECCFGA